MVCFAHLCVSCPAPNSNNKSSGDVDGKLSPVRYRVCWCVIISFRPRPLFQKCDGTCRTDFKKTRSKQDVIHVFKDFVGGNVSIIVRGNELSSTQTCIVDPRKKYITACTQTHRAILKVTWEATPTINTALEYALTSVFIVWTNVYYFGHGLCVCARVECV